MEDNIAISVKNLQKIYKLYESPMERLKEALSITGKKYHKIFYALRDISLDVEKGLSVGIIGTNGSGKSTFLKIVTGVLNPTKGSVNINGRVSALLELGIGFNMEYTGIENIYLSGTVMGFTKEQMDLRIKDIVDFADIGDFINQPVKTYSSGMFARLAFSVAISVEPEILIVDEALSVGDIKFQQKCYRKMEKFKKDKTVLLVTHDMGAITKFCDKVIWIEKGNLMDYGDPITVSRKYQAYLQNYELNISDDTLKKDVQSIQEKKNLKGMNLSIHMEKDQSFGDKVAQITGTGVFDSVTGESLTYIYPKTRVAVLIMVKNNEVVLDEIVGFTVKDRLSNIVFQMNSFDLQGHVHEQIGEFVYKFEFEMPQLNTGEYMISPAVASGTQANHIQHHWVYDAYLFRIISDNNNKLEGFMYISQTEFEEV